MPTGKKTVAKEICEGMKTVDLTGIVPEESSKSKTGYVNVIELKNGKLKFHICFCSVRCRMRVAARDSKASLSGDGEP